MLHLRHTSLSSFVHLIGRWENSDPCAKACERLIRAKVLCLLDDLVAAVAPVAVVCVFVYVFICICRIFHRCICIILTALHVCIEPGWWCCAKFGRPRAPDEQKRERLRQKGGFAKAPGYSWPCSTRVTYVQAPASSETLSCNVSSMVKVVKNLLTYNAMVTCWDCEYFSLANS